MKITLILLSAFSILSCQTKKHNQNLEAQSTLSEKDIVSKKDHPIKTIPKALKINKEPSYISKKSAITLLTLEDFSLNSRSRSKKENDSLFIEFLKSFTAYQNQINDSLFSDSNYEIYNTLIYSDEELINAKAKEFEMFVEQVGFSISSSEGMIFLEKDTNFLNKFTDYLSERMNSFKTQYIKEIKYPIAEDAGIIISNEEIVQRILFWENFSKSQKDFEIPNYAQNEFQMNLYYLMFGMDNTPIYKWDKPHEIKSEIIETFNHIIEKYPKSKAAQYLNDYILFIEENNYQYDSSYNEYARKKFPFMYGN